jgi:hypothetical protein
MVIVTQTSILLNLGGRLEEFSYIVLLFNQAGVNAIENIKCQGTLLIDSTA